MPRGKGCSRSSVRLVAVKVFSIMRASPEPPSQPSRPGKTHYQRNVHGLTKRVTFFIGAVAALYFSGRCWYNGEPGISGGVISTSVFALNRQGFNFSFGPRPPRVDIVHFSVHSALAKRMVISSAC